jgi:hypothetical protein
MSNKQESWPRDNVVWHAERGGWQCRVRSHVASPGAPLFWFADTRDATGEPWLAQPYASRGAAQNYCIDQAEHIDRQRQEAQ